MFCFRCSPQITNNTVPHALGRAPLRLPMSVEQFRHDKLEAHVGLHLAIGRMADKTPHPPFVRHHGVSEKIVHVGPDVPAVVRGNLRVHRRERRSRVAKRFQLADEAGLLGVKVETGLGKKAVPDGSQLTGIAQTDGALAFRPVVGLDTPPAGEVRGQVGVETGVVGRFIASEADIQLPAYSFRNAGYTASNKLTSSTNLTVSAAAGSCGAATIGHEKKVPINSNQEIKILERSSSNLSIMNL